MDSARKVGSFTYKDPLTKRHKSHSFKEPHEIVCPDNTISQVHKFQDMENPDKWTATNPLFNFFSTRVDEYRDVTITKVKIEDVLGLREKRNKNY